MRVVSTFFVHLVSLFVVSQAKDVSDVKEANGRLWRSPIRAENQQSSANHLITYSNQQNSDEGETHSDWEKPKPKHVPKGTSQDKSLLDSLRMPGTHWCGKGWRTDSFYKLGGYSSADRCCRQHDLGCPISIQPGETKFGLTNIRVHTVMHCTCDDRFRSCLKMSRSAPGQIVANLFFNILNIPCFVFTKTEVCTERNWWGSCLNTKVMKKAVWRKSLPF